MSGQFRPITGRLHHQNDGIENKGEGVEKSAKEGEGGG